MPYSDTTLSYPTAAIRPSPVRETRFPETLRLSASVPSPTTDHAASPSSLDTTVRAPTTTSPYSYSTHQSESSLSVLEATKAATFPLSDTATERSTEYPLKSLA